MSWWCHRLTIFHSFFFTENDKKFHISATRKYNLPYIHPEYVFMQNNVCSDIQVFWYGDVLLHVWAKTKTKTKIKILYTEYMEKSEAITSSTHSFPYIRMDCSRNVSWKCETLQFYIFFICNLIFIKFVLFCLKIFILSIEYI